MAVLCKTKQALRNCIAKGSLAHKASLLTEATVLVGVEDPASKVASVNGSDATRDTYQRKVFFDDTTFFIVYWDLGDKKMYYVASVDGKSWGSRVELWEFNIAPYYGGNVDIGYPNRGALDLGGQPFDFSIAMSGSYGVLNWMAFRISGQVLTELSGTQLAGVWQGGSVVPPFGATYDVWVFHSASRLLTGVFATERGESTEVSYGGTTTGGSQILTYKSSSPYDLFVLAKGGDNKLYYNTCASIGTPFRGSFTEIATLGTGFSDFCACSEAQNTGDPEQIHLVYIKSTGELCYRKFESDTLGSETVLVSSGATYPVIACGLSGRLYVFYVKAGEIMMRKFDGSSWQAQEQPFPGHSYHTPTYLSSNQNVQDGKICLVWTEGTSAPYAVWFCYLQEPILIDYYYDATPNSEMSIGAVHPSETAYKSAHGQCFKPTESRKITSVKFQLKKVGSPTGNLVACLYLMGAGEFGNAGKPAADAEPLATSDVVDIASLGAGYSLPELMFLSAQQYRMLANTPYCVCFQVQSGVLDDSNYILTGRNKPGTHEGNAFLFVNGAWGGYTDGTDAIFYVYGV